MRTPRRPRGATVNSKRAWPPSATALDSLIEEATVDANGDEERFVGMFTMVQDALKVPFEVEILGVAATVEGVDLTDAGEIVAICKRGKNHQAIPILSLRLSSERPRGAEWIEAYRRMVRWS